MSASFLTRWSQLKAASRRPDPAPAESGEQDGHLTEEMTPPVPDLPPVDELTAESDFRPFLQAGVPAELRAQALRKLWQSDPTLAAMDPLDLHNLDYSLPSLGEVVATAWQIGRGFAEEAERVPSHTPEDLEKLEEPSQLSKTADRASDAPEDDVAGGSANNG
jgi:hypothetical protein